MTRRRRLRPDELDLWSQVARTTSPLGRARARIPAKPAAPTAEPPSVEEHKFADFRIGQKAETAAPRNVLVPSIPKALSADPLAMDKKAFARLKRGKLRPEARLDLHGMTLEQAHPSLIGFIQRAYATEKRLVLVITGKGKTSDDDGPIPRRVGVLRHQVPQWLKMPPLLHAVLQVTAAHNRHGGSGAYYIYLRRRK